MKRSFKIFLVSILCVFLSISASLVRSPVIYSTQLGGTGQANPEYFSGKVTIADSSTTPPLNLTERSTSPSSPSSGDIYLDDGTNCTDGSNPCLRRYTGAAWEDINNTGSGSPYTGDYKWSAQTADHGNWLLCDGGTVLRSSSLGTLLVSLGLPFGVGDGSTTVNIPDPAGRSLLGVGSGSGLTPRSLGDEGGEEDHQLVVSEMPAHTHQQTRNLSGADALGNLSQNLGNTSQAMTYSYTESSGGDGSHNTMHPFLAVGNLFIYAGS